MGAIQTPGITAEQILTHYSKLVRERFSESDKSLGEVVVRKFNSCLEPEAFYKEGNKSLPDKVPFDRARFRLVMSNGREEWCVVIDLIFHSRKRLLSDGSMVGAGVQFNVISDEGKGLLIDYFSIDTDEEFRVKTADEWCSHWFSKLVKSSNISAIFAHKEFVRELEY